MPLRRHPNATSESNRLLTAIPIDHALVGRLRTTYEGVRAQGLRLAEVFYARLFAKAPHLRAMFRSDLESQSKKLMDALDAVVRNFEHPVESAAMIDELGRRHAGYGASPEHYDLVIDLLIDSMREILGAAAGAGNGTAAGAGVGATAAIDRALEEWRLALRLISDRMIASSTSTAPIHRAPR